MTQSSDRVVSRDSGAVGAAHAVSERINWDVMWTCEKWDQDKVDFVLAKLLESNDPRIIQSDGIWVPHNVSGEEVWRPYSDGLPSDFLREYGIEPDEITVIEGNLLLNEGIGRLLDLLTA